MHRTHGRIDPAPRRFACTPAWHRLISSSASAFQRETTPAGRLDSGAATYELGECRGGCGTTLARRLLGLEADDVRDAAESYARREWKAEHE